MATPTINNQFWFDISKKMVEGSSDRRRNAASLLQKTIGWLWGVYTGGAFIGLGITDTPYSFTSIILIASPSPLLLIAYCATVWAQIPLDVEFDPRSPTEIMEAYCKGSQIESYRLKVALVVTFLAAISVSMALVEAAVEKNSAIETSQSIIQALEKVV
ncbi:MULTISPECIES: hypothetical protein [Vibrio]|uniref:hypothetical protein n=1 Tax=Vibrio TaxID=662 RepID=UPI001BD453EC|nr:MULTISPECIES: hypothetical protein [Vibrio]MBS9965073.1 hypothetical protein [Vibrio alginolyticus]MDW1535907.1 hypothetical protein [Vibrio sp. Y159]